jgi:hypothetical protein
MVTELCARKQEANVGAVHGAHRTGNQNVVALGMHALHVIAKLHLTEALRAALRIRTLKGDAGTRQQAEAFSPLASLALGAKVIVLAIGALEALAGEIPRPALVADNVWMRCLMRRKEKSHLRLCALARFR